MASAHPLRPSDPDGDQPTTVLHALTPRAAPRRAWRAEAVWLGVAMALALLVAAVVLQLWVGDLRIPFTIDGDALASVAGIKGMIDHGWFLSNPSVGAPLGAHFNDFAGSDGDTLQLLLVRLVAVVSHDPATVLNLYYLLGYALVAGAAFAVLRDLGFERPTAVVGAVVYSALPYHFMRGENHLFLGAYFAVPAICWLVLRILMGERLVGRSWRTPLTAATVLAVVVAGGSTVYYAVFALLLLGSATLVRLTRVRDLRALLPGGLAVAAITVVLAGNLAPGILYRHAHGANAAVAHRDPAESETYASSLTQTVLPIPGHRIPALAKVQADYLAHTDLKGEMGMQIGLVLSLGLAGLLLGLLARGAAAGATGPPTRQARLAGAAGVGLLLALAFATVGGLGSLFAHLISPQIRGWNRLTPFIAFFALVGVALALDAVAARLRARGGSRLVPVAAVVLVGLVALYDQTSPTYRPYYADNAATWHDDARFVAQIEHRLPAGAMVLQLPLHAFPETPVRNDWEDYDLFKGYVHSRDLRWSYGAMKGRPEDWTAPLRSKPVDTVLDAALARGFKGIYVDRYGYADHGKAAEAQIRARLGVTGPTVVSHDRRLAFYATARAVDAGR